MTAVVTVAVDAAAAARPLRLATRRDGDEPQSAARLLFVAAPDSSVAPRATPRARETVRKSNTRSLRKAPPPADSSLLLARQTETGRKRPSTTRKSDRGKTLSRSRASCGRSRPGCAGREATPRQA